MFIKKNDSNAKNVFFPQVDLNSYLLQSCGPLWQLSFQKPAFNCSIPSDAHSYTQAQLAKIRSKHYS